MIKVQTSNVEIVSENLHEPKKPRGKGGRDRFKKKCERILFYGTCAHVKRNLDRCLSKKKRKEKIDNWQGLKSPMHAQSYAHCFNNPNTLHYITFDI